MDVGFNIKSLKSGSIIPIIAGLLLLVALWMAWSGWQLFSSSRLASATVDLVEYDVSLKKRLWPGLQRMFLG